MGATESRDWLTRQSFTAMLRFSQCGLTTPRRCPMRLSNHSRLLLLAIVLIACATGARAEDFPTKPIRLIVADAPGGAPDQLGRMVAQKLGDGLGQPVIVDNRAGAGGVVGTDVAAKAPADGYTLLLIT